MDHKITCPDCGITFSANKEKVLHRILDFHIEKEHPLFGQVPSQDEYPHDNGYDDCEHDID